MLIRKALVIGVDDYGDSMLGSSSISIFNGKSVCSHLKLLGYYLPENYKLLGYTEFNSMREAVIDFFAEGDIDDNEGELLFFYYSGVAIPDYKDVYLTTSETNPHSPYRKSFPFYDLTRLVRSSNSLNIFIALDLFYVPLTDAISIDPTHIKAGMNYLEFLFNEFYKETSILASNQKIDDAQELKQNGNSLFTYYLLKGLEAENMFSRDKNGNVTPNSLSKYINISLNSLASPPKYPLLTYFDEQLSLNTILANYSNSQ